MRCVSCVRVHQHHRTTKSIDRTIKYLLLQCSAVCDCFVADSLALLFRSSLCVCVSLSLSFCLCLSVFLLVVLSHTFFLSRSLFCDLRPLSFSVCRFSFGFDRPKSVSSISIALVRSFSVSRLSLFCVLRISFVRAARHPLFTHVSVFVG